MKVRCYAVFDAKIADFHLAIFDIKDEGAIRQFADAVSDKQTKWNKHPEDYSLWFVGVFDTSKGMLDGTPTGENGVLPVNLVNASAVLPLTVPEVMDGERR